MNSWLFHTLGYNPVLHFVQIVLALAIESYFSWLLGPFDIPQSMWVLLFFFLAIVYFPEISFLKISVSGGPEGGWKRGSREEEGTGGDAAAPQHQAPMSAPGARLSRLSRGCLWCE